VPYGLYSTEPKGRSPEGDDYYYYYCALISTNSINYLIKVIVLEGPKHTEVTDDCRTQPILLVVLLGMLYELYGT